jgi:hypothetical protein
MITEPEPKVCMECEEEPRHARGLGKRCYWRHYRNGTLGQFASRGQAGNYDVTKLAEVTYRQLDWWARMGYLRPVHEGGSGVWRQWPDEEIAVVQRMGRLVAVGIPPALAEKVARGISDLGHGVRITLTDATPTTDTPETGADRA